MTPDDLLAHFDQGRLWAANSTWNTAQAYQAQLAVRGLRIARGEQPRGFKIGFTNRTIWPRYGVDGPIWGTVWNTTLSHCEEDGVVSLGLSCQPRIEPEAVFGIARTPPLQASLQELFDCVEWVAPGFEIVQSHSPGWKFKAADTIADGGLHAHLLVGRKVPVREVADSAAGLDGVLASCAVSLLQDGVQRDSGRGANVLDGPLHALHHFLQELSACPGAPPLQAGDVVTTGTWTDAWPVEQGQTWAAAFGAPLGRLAVRFS